MLNLALGTVIDDAGRSRFVTGVGQAGHAIYGPYEFREAGAYRVDFSVELAAADRPRGNPVCAVLDVVRDGGSDVLVSRKLRVSDLTAGRTSFRLPFDLERRSKLEYRVWVSGAVPLRLDEHRRVDRRNEDAQPVAMAPDFPPPDADLPDYVRANYQRFREHYDRGFGLAIVDGSAVLGKDGLFFHVRCDDDFNFIGEVFLGNVYNFITDGPVCAIDVGMNIGFSSLQFAQKANVEEVFSFEPFPETYARALDNIALNPPLAAKITPACIGLSDRDWTGEIGMANSDDSGSRTVVASTGDRPVTVTLRDAGETLRPILRSARERGLRTVLKVDCEGSEFAIFRSLERAGLFADIDAVMVEWHAMFDEVNQLDLIRPLRDAGFIVFDQSPPSGNGFFYGVRLANR